MPAELYVGLMSGTSLDGVDAALVACNAGRTECVASHYLPFPDDLRTEALALQTPGTNELHRAALFGNRLADLYAESITTLLASSATPATSVQAVGCHGQTIRHAPADGYTIQLVNAARLAEACGIKVIADFRSRDIAAGGQGAPLVPALHEALFRNPTNHRVILNIGGIANLTDLAPGRATVGFDTGPGNMLMDAWIWQHLGQRYDRDGAWATSGRVLPDLLTALRAHTYFDQAPPRSCGREEFGVAYLDACLKGDESPQDVQATLLEFTASTVADAIHRWCGSMDELYVCGGGAHNSALMTRLAQLLAPALVTKTDALGLPADWVEAVAFAWLARQTLHGLPGNLPSATGARGTRLLGAIYPA